MQEEPESGSFTFIPWSELTEFQNVGRGNFGIVRKADYLGTEVAVKELLDISAEQPGFDFGKYVEREIGILKESRHPNVVQFMGCSKHENKIYLITEFVNGGNLKDWIVDPSKGLTWRLCVGFAIDTARALAYLHANRIIHRDLKCENLLITENRRVKLCDFGLSRFAAKTKEESRRLSYCGTDQYMAPEIQFCMEFDASVDVFSFGIILCEMITRRPAEVDVHIKRVMPGFGIDAEEIRSKMESSCPPELFNLAIECASDEGKNRPSLKQVLKQLRALEVELVQVDAVNMGVMPDVGGEDTGSAAQSVDRLNASDDRLNDPQRTGSVTTRKQADAGPTAIPLGADSLPGSMQDLAVTVDETHPFVVEGISLVRVGHCIPHRFSIETIPTLARCEGCRKRIGLMSRHLCCDDCHQHFHKSCGAVAPNCGLPAQARDQFMQLNSSASGSIGAVIKGSAKPGPGGAGSANLGKEKPVQAIQPGVESNSRR
ncbi:kinase-like domain-containing protein [Polychytrium aggregatum]|uniref:kinase-like domain-containing protein n=1 Tax=Polychytrium aggregatum TaxID=110093 RepID=UPI0022FEE4E0|nr:kinase-like domain-containing protein [Polychytrium aggregatum]KAI9207611.1 kinase-like domain-containing protein [Polychytrium aggregatum]